jgi:hypothetical protein
MKLGQMASIIRCRNSPACTVRIAVHIMATKARTCKHEPIDQMVGVHTSDEDSRDRAVHAKDGSNSNREGDMIICADLASGRDDKGADEEAEKDDGDGLARSEAEGHDRRDGRGKRRSKHV